MLCCEIFFKVTVYLRLQWDCVGLLFYFILIILFGKYPSFIDVKAKTQMLSNF